MSRDLDAGTSVAGSDVTTNEGVNAGPGVTSKHIIECGGASRVAADDGVVVLVENVGSEQWGYVYAAFMENEIVLCRKVGVSV